MELLRYIGQFLYVLSLHTEAYAGTTQEYIHQLIEGPGMIYRQVGAVKPGHMVTLQCRSGSHDGPHARDALQTVDSIAKLSAYVINVMSWTKEIKVAVHGFIPCLPSLFFRYPSGIARRRDELLIGIKHRGLP
jgi:hypothetical protein